MTARSGTSEDERFARLWEIIVLALLLVLVLIVFFPKKRLDRQFAEQKQYNEVAVVYMENLLKKHPKDEVLILELANQQIAKGSLIVAHKTLKPLLKSKNKKTRDQANWLNYKILESQIYSLKPGIERQSRIFALQKEAQKLSGEELTIEQLEELASSALALGQPRLALHVYKRLLTLPEQEKNPDILAKAGRVALSVSDFEASANFYLKAKRQVKTKELQRKYFIAAMDALQAGGKLDLAIKLAQQNLTGLENDRKTLFYMNRLALSANKPQIAIQYSLKLMKQGQKETP